MTLAEFAIQFRDFLRTFLQRSRRKPSRRREALLQRAVVEALEIRHRIFECFVRGRKAHCHSTTGLGLPVGQGIARGQRGRIGTASRPG